MVLTEPRFPQRFLKRKSRLFLSPEGKGKTLDSVVRNPSPQPRWSVISPSLQTRSLNDGIEGKLIIVLSGEVLDRAGTPFLQTTKDNTRADKLELVRSKIRPYADFPKAGITFHDVFGVMSDPTGLRALMDLVQEEATLLKDEIDAVVGLDSRGFLFGPHMALAAGVGFVPVRYFSINCQCSSPGMSSVIDSKERQAARSIGHLLV